MVRVIPEYGKEGYDLGPFESPDAAIQAIQDLEAPYDGAYAYDDTVVDGVLYETSRYNYQQE